MPAPETSTPAEPATPHFLTLTGNLLAEHTWEFSQWKTGQTQRAQTESFQVGGKGINVSRMLARLGAGTTALCFAGGPSGDACLAWLRTRGLPHRAFPTTSPTRQGFVLRSADGVTPETTFLGRDAAPDAAALAACAEELRARAELPGQILAFCGSFPGWDSPAAEPLKSALTHWLHLRPLVVDTYGPPLAWFAQQPVYLLKINRDELRQLIPAATNIPEALAQARARCRVQNWIITDGPAPAYLSTPDGAISAFAPPVLSREISPTGSGDVLLAAILHFHFLQKQPLADALRRALPYASANAAHPGIAEFDLNQLP